jgi:hypothetical protein
MRQTDHERIAEAVASIQPSHFSESVLQNLKRGSTYPDFMHKRRAHHHSRESDIKTHVLRARYWFLHNEFSRSAFDLGIAFHYIADATCPGSDKGRKHQE